MITSNETIYTEHGSASAYILYMMHVCAHYIHPEYHIQPTALITWENRYCHSAIYIYILYACIFVVIFMHVSLYKPGPNPTLNQP